jgi:helix-turn-helix protein/RDD family protein
VPVVSPQEQLRLAREARGEDLVVIARRLGLRVEMLRAIEEGRFSDLPRGLYGRSAIRTYAAALGLDAAAILSRCEPLLPAIEDPIVALAILRGVRPARSHEGAACVHPAEEDPIESPRKPIDATAVPTWRLMAAAATDAGVIGALNAVTFGLTLLFCRCGPGALVSGGAAPFALFGLLMAASYFIYFGGIAGQTPGERALHVVVSAERGSPHDLRRIIDSAVRCALREVLVLRLSGWRVGMTRASLPGYSPADTPSGDASETAW